MILTIIAWALMLISIWYIPYRLRQLSVVRKVWLWRFAVALIFGAYMLILNKGIYTNDNPFTAILFNVLGFFPALDTSPAITETIAQTSDRDHRHFIIRHSCRLGICQCLIIYHHLPSPARYRIR